MVKKRTGLIFIVAVLILSLGTSVYAFSLSEWYKDIYNYYKERSYSPMFNPTTNFVGLPSGFSPTLTYYHNMSGSLVRIALWDASGKLYQSNDGLNFNEITRSSLDSQGLPSSFIPTVGIFGNISDSGGRLILFNSNGQSYWTRDGKGTIWNEWLETNKVNKGLPANYKPVSARYTFLPAGIQGRGVMVLIDAQGQEYRWNNASEDWNNLTSSYDQQRYNNFPKLKAPKINLYYNLGGQQRNFYVFTGNNKGDYFEFNPTDNRFYNITSQITGLPASSPSSGYYDPIRSRLVLWFGSSAYESSDGLAFSAITIGSQTCTPNWQCTSWSTCTNNVQTRTCTDSNNCGISCGGNSDCITSQSCTSPSCTTNLNCGSPTITVMCKTSTDISINRTRTPTCSGGSCTTVETNITNTDCEEDALFCYNGDCVECLTNDDCLSGEICNSNKACAQSQVCSDSDSGASSKYSKGHINITIGSTKTSYNDSCYNSTILQEYSCSTSATAVMTNYSCSAGCSNSACNQETDEEITCIDSDGGLNYIERGLMTSNDSGLFESYYDECDESDSDILYEYFCDEDNYWDVAEKDCSELNKVCKLGVCAPKGISIEPPIDGGTCTTSKCVDVFYQECVGGELLEAELIPGKCGYLVEEGCEDDDECGEGEFCNSDNECETMSVCESDNDCGDGEFCNSDGDCEVKGQIDPIYYFLIALVILIIVTILIAVYLFIKRKNHSQNTSQNNANQKPTLPPPRPPFNPNNQNIARPVMPVMQPRAPQGPLPPPQNRPPLQPSPRPNQVPNQNYPPRQPMPNPQNPGQYRPNP